MIDFDIAAAGFQSQPPSHYYAEQHSITDADEYAALGRIPL
jgi:hypothetical protein